MEGTLLGFPSIALSQCYSPRRRRFWDCAETHAPALIEQDRGARPSAGRADEPQFSRLRARGGAGRRRWRGRGAATQELMKIERAPSTGAAIPITGSPSSGPTFIAGEGTDLEAVAQKRISVTPLRLDLTDDSGAEPFRRACS